MSTKFFFKKFSIENFRVFKKIDFDEMRRINLISGINGSGKSALIETIFLSLDLNNPICLMRPFQWRGIPLSGNDLQLLFPDISKAARILAGTQSGEVDINLTYGRPDKDVIFTASQNVDPNARSAISQLASNKIDGVTIVANKSISNEQNRWFVSQAGENINATGVGTGNPISVRGVYLSQFAPVSPQESADRISQLIKQGKKQKILQYMRLMSPAIKDVAVFQDGAIAQIYVTLADEAFRPLALMGGGLRAFIELVISVMSSSNGVVFVDELDSALHFSIIPKLWSVIAQISNDENVQIFAIAHSRETIASAALGIKNAGRSNDFQYVRIDDMDSHHRCVRYSMEELESAIELHVEIR